MVLHNYHLLWAATSSHLSYFPLVSVFWQSSFHDFHPLVFHFFFPLLIFFAILFVVSQLSIWPWSVLVKTVINSAQPFCNALMYEIKPVASSFYFENDLLSLIWSNEIIFGQNTCELSSDIDSEMTQSFYEWSWLEGTALYPIGPCIRSMWNCPKISGVYCTCSAWLFIVETVVLQGFQTGDSKSGFWLFNLKKLLSQEVICFRLLLLAVV